MSKKLEIRWKIEAYSPDTMPLDRLLQYIHELSSLLSPNQRNLHLLRIEAGSTVPVFVAEAEHLTAIHAHGEEIRKGTAPTSALASYRKINRMLREDSAHARLYEIEEGREAEIIPFPGKQEGPPLIKRLRQQGSVDGRLVRLGGVKNQVPLALRKQDSTMVTGLLANRDLARDLGQHLFEPIRLYGTGFWTLPQDGHWDMESFIADRYELLESKPLSDIVRQLREVEVDWPENPIDEMLNEATD